MGVLKMKVGGSWVPVSQGWSPLAGGIVTSAITTAAMASIGSTVVDLTGGASVTWTANPARTYKITAVSGRIDQFTAQGNAFMAISDAANANKAYNYTAPASGFFGHIVAIEIATGLSGTITRKLRVNTSAGTCTIQAGTLLLVEDITAVAPDLAANPLPTGWIGHAVQTADQATNTTPVDLPGMSVGPFTIPSTNRKILITATVVAYQTVAAGYATLAIVSTPSGGQSMQGLLQANDQMPIAMQWVLTGVSGSYTIKLQGSTSAGTCTWKSAAGFRTHLVVQDIGG